MSDLLDLLHSSSGPTGAYTVAWLGNEVDRDDVAGRISPLTYVREGLPPVLMIHGDADPTVPYSQGVRLHQALGQGRRSKQAIHNTGRSARWIH